VSSGASGAYYDLHSHLMPGVDDGVRTVEEALDGVERMVTAGIRHIVTTPHFRGSLTREPDAFASRMEAMDRAWGRVSEAVADAFPSVEFGRGHEVMLDVPDVDLSDARLRLDGTGFVLVEWPRLRVPPETASVIRRIRFAGLKPVIAHPERYYGVDPELAVLERWREAGASLQVTHGSLVGRYGDQARAQAFRILKRGWADYLSTDFHGPVTGEVYLDEARDVLEGQGGREHFELLTRTNPARLLQDQDPMPVPGLELGRGFWQRLKELFASDSV